MHIHIQLLLYLSQYMVEGLFVTAARITLTHRTEELNEPPSSGL